MKFHWDGEEHTLKEVLVELANQYADNHLDWGLETEESKGVKGNLEVLEFAIEEVSDLPDRKRVEILEQLKMEDMK